jgi:hypothetical protein
MNSNVCEEKNNINEAVVEVGRWSSFCETLSEGESLR